MGDFLQGILPCFLSDNHTYAIHTFQGKPNLLKNLKERLRGYRTWLPDCYRIVIMVDRDDDDCLSLKKQLEDAALTSGLRTRSSVGDTCWQVVNRIVVEELEAWYFGDWEAVRCAYPKVSPAVPNWKPYKDPDAIAGGTWEAFERILKRKGYFQNGLRKVEAARAIAPHIDPGRNRSSSFRAFRDAIAEATA